MQLMLQQLLRQQQVAQLLVKKLVHPRAIATKRLARIRPVPIAARQAKIIAARIKLTIARPSAAILLKSSFFNVDPSDFEFWVC